MAFPVSVLVGVADSIIKRIWPDPEKQALAQLELAKLEQSGELAKIVGQMEINKEEAKSTNWLIAGWRPAVGWVCAFGLAHAAVIDPLIRFVAQVVFGYTGGFPEIDTMLTMQILAGMLGLAGMRTFEKTKDVARG